ncbi:DUF2945 domain-containing protein [Cognatishimia sp. F0-27]|uniref:DUF2945 domain-containing protein n=1 Tax=Cognatishimia sp. F0-27 TaxID=2816855 RepID=UPI001D0CC09C|nr:DUF2945 domain-containing protein [Cognatishimia sp. F0-27]MCC1493878.1 DUF2945 domain-containing protein [Cognatishimia sp. F0-27]
MTLKVGDKVAWDWGTGTASGTIKQIYKNDVSKTIKGNTVKRHASDDEPAYLIEQDDDDRVLKSASEVRGV